MIYRATIMDKGSKDVAETIHQATMKRLIEEVIKPLKDPGLFAHFYRCDDIGSPSRVFMGVMRT